MIIINDSVVFNINFGVQKSKINPIKYIENI